MTALKNLRFSSKNTVPKKEVGEKKNQKVHKLQKSKCSPTAPK